MVCLGLLIISNVCLFCFVVLEEYMFVRMWYWLVLVFWNLFINVIGYWLCNCIFKGLLGEVICWVNMWIKLLKFMCCSWVFCFVMCLWINVIFWSNIFRVGVLFNCLLCVLFICFRFFLSCMWKFFSGLIVVFVFFMFFCLVLKWLLFINCLIFWGMVEKLLFFS